MQNGLLHESWNGEDIKTGAYGVGCIPDISALPDGIVFDIVMDYLVDSVSDSVRLSKCCRALNRIVSDEYIWEQKLNRRFGSDSTLFHHPYKATPGEVPHPRKLYGATHALERRFSMGEFRQARILGTSNTIITSTMLYQDRIVLGDMKGIVQSFDESNVLPPKDVAHPNGSPVTCLTQLNGVVLSGHTDGSIMHGHQSIRILDESVRIDSVGLFQSNQLSVCSTNDRSVSICDLPASTAPISVKRFSPDSAPTRIASFPVDSIFSSSLLVGQRDCCASVIDLRSGRNSHQLNLTDWCLSVATSSIGPFITKASDKAVNYFDLRKPNQAVSVKHRGNRLISDFASDDKLRLASCGLDGKVKVSSLEKDGAPVVLLSEPDYILSLDFSRTTLVCGGLSGKAHIFNF
jgi:hypothetical protein